MPLLTTLPPLMTLFAALLALGAVTGLVVALRALADVRRLAPLGEGTRDADDEAQEPTVAVVVAARDEAATIGPALESLLAQAGGGVRVVVVDDRSEDGTTEILRAAAARHPELTVVRVDALPPGWLGKNHALQVGADAAGPVDFLLFTDADVVFAPGGVRAAARLAAENELDHLTGAPRVVAVSFFLAGAIAAFGVLLGAFARPWRARDPRSSAAVGIGALNLVRRTSYVDAGGHGPIRMRIDDDLSLGRLIKVRGGRSEFVYASEVASVEWYPSLAAMMQGLQKNAFAGIEFRASVAVAATLFIALAFLAPFVLPLLPGIDAATRVLALVAAAAHVAGAAAGARRLGLHPSAALLLPFGMALFLAVLWRSALSALVLRRVVWRGTAYPLAELIAARDSSRRALRT